MTFAVESLLSDWTMTSSEPWTSALRMIGSSLTSPLAIRVKSESSEMREVLASASSRSFCWRNPVTCRAFDSSSTTWRGSPGVRDVVEAHDLDGSRGAGLVDALAAVVEHRADAADRGAGEEDVADLERSVPGRGPWRGCRGPDPRGGLEDDAAGRARRRRPSARAGRPGGGSSRAGASIPICFLAEISPETTSPPNSSTRTPLSASACLTRMTFASGLSILLMATTIGTLAARAWSIASAVCGMTPSSAATTRTTMSVALAPRARIIVKASWPGVSRKTICAALDSTR